MAKNGLGVELAALKERLISIDGKVSAAHSRIDKTEQLIKDDFGEIKADLKSLALKLEDVTSIINRGKGWATAALLLAGILGGTMSKGIASLMSPR